MTSPKREGSPPNLVRPFLHPSISRLRSGVPQSPQRRSASYSSTGTAHLLGREQATPSPSHFSSISRTSSVSNLRTDESAPQKDASKQEAFKWTSLRTVGEQLFLSSPDKAGSILGTPVLGSPTVLAANGLICVGTDAGRVFVFDFKQELKCICGDDNSGESQYVILAVSQCR